MSFSENDEREGVGDHAIYYSIESPEERCIAGSRIPANAPDVAWLTENQACPGSSRVHVGWVPCWCV